MRVRARSRAHGRRRRLDRAPGLEDRPACWHLRPVPGGRAGALAIKNIVKVDGLLALVNCFSGGVFLCAGLTHILPHVVEHGASVKGYGEYPLPYVLVMLGYMLVFLVERESCSTSTSTRRSTTRTRAVTATATATATVVPDTRKTARTRTSCWPATRPIRSRTRRALRIAHRHALYVGVSVLVAISLHAVLAGVSLGMQGSTSRVAAVAVAICSHKGPAAFSVGSKFLRSGLPTSQVVALVLAFTLVTPFGIVVGILSGAWPDREACARGPGVRDVPVHRRDGDFLGRVRDDARARATRCTARRRRAPGGRRRKSRTRAHAPLARRRAARRDSSPSPRTPWACSRSS